MYKYANGCEVSICSRDTIIDRVKFDAVKCRLSHIE